MHAKKDLVTLAAVQSVACDRENREAKQLLALTLPVGPLLISWCWLLHRKSSTTVSSAWLAQNTAISICVDIIPVFTGYKQAFVNENHVGWTLDESSSHTGWYDKWKLRRLYCFLALNDRLTFISVISTFRLRIIKKRLTPPTGYDFLFFNRISKYNFILQVIIVLQNVWIKIFWFDLIISNAINDRIFVVT